MRFDPRVSDVATVPPARIVIAAIREGLIGKLVSSTNVEIKQRYMRACSYDTHLCLYLFFCFDHGVYSETSLHIDVIYGLVVLQIP